jgi:hypothetical protein
VTVLANILDPIHDTLAPEVWDNPGSPTPKLKEQHRKWITATVTGALTDAGYTHVEEWLSLVLTGSLTTYQYSPDSDVDVSRFVDAEAFPEWSRAELIGIMVSEVDGTELPGTSYPMQCFVVDTKTFSREDLYRPGLRSGYDLATDDWIVPPDRTRVLDVEKEMNVQYVLALEAADKMERLLRYEPDKAIMYWHQIHKRRQRDMRAGKGDYSESNIVYKFLANRDLFPKIAELSGEYIAKTARPQDRQVAKFVFDPIENKLLIGRMAAEEGEAESHPDLARKAGFNLNNGLLFGQINKNGYVETFTRPLFTGFGKSPMNQYEADWRLHKALQIAVPGVIVSPETPLNPKWDQAWTPPEVTFLGQRPELNATNQPPTPEGTWSF